MDQAAALLHLNLGGEFALAIYVFPLVMASITDWRSLRIPNWLTAMLALAFPVAALLGGQPVDWLSHIEAGVLVFVGSAVLFALRIMGGGDVKLLAAVALWLGLGQLLSFLTLTALVGGGFAFLVLMLRHPLVQTTLLATLRRLPAFADKKMPIPYGIPIAVAALLMAPVLPIFA
ncbi:MAG TPA: prepilin peptidase [Stellaceae bacterium]|nr:prepilin peptidase [Stellaceae bacterium]